MIARSFGKGLLFTAAACAITARMGRPGPHRSLVAPRDWHHGLRSGGKGAVSFWRATL